MVLNASIRRVTKLQTRQQLSMTTPIIVAVTALTIMCMVLYNPCFVTVTAFTAKQVSNERTTNYPFMNVLPLQKHQHQQQQQEQKSLKSMSSSLLFLSSSNTDEGTAAEQQEESFTEDNGAVASDTTNSDDSPKTEITSTDEQQQQQQQEQMITAIKEEIAQLEKDVKAARNQLANINDNADEYTKTGYARKVAEMENMRRARTMLQSSNKFSATAALLSEFLPAMETLNALKDKYETDEFGKMYNALPDAIRSGFTSMGCVEYTVSENEPFVANKMMTIGTEPSSTVPNDAVIRTMVPGIELQGNIVRLAQVITSSGAVASSTEETAAVAVATTEDVELDIAVVGPDSTDATLPPN